MSETCFYTNAEEWAFAVTKNVIRQGDAGKEIGISDIDDTLVDSSLRWYEDYKRLAVEKGVDLQVVTLREFKERGYRRCTMELELVEDYDEYKLLRMHSSEFHVGMAAVQGTEVLLGNSNLPGGYITTRPAVLGEATYQNLQQHGFRRAPLLLRPAHVPYEKTIPFKIDALVTLRSMLDEADLPEVGVHYIDDYVGVIDGINELSRRALAGIHFGAHNSWESIAQQFVPEGRGSEQSS